MHQVQRISVLVIRISVDCEERLDQRNDNETTPSIERSPSQRCIYIRSTTQFFLEIGGTHHGPIFLFCHIVNFSMPIGTSVPIKGYVPALEC